MTGAPACDTTISSPCPSAKVTAGVMASNPDPKTTSVRKRFMLHLRTSVVARNAATLGLPRVRLKALLTRKLARTLPNDVRTRQDVTHLLDLPFPSRVAVASWGTQRQGASAKNVDKLTTTVPQWDEMCVTTARALPAKRLTNIGSGGPYLQPHVSARSRR